SNFTTAFLSSLRPRVSRTSTSSRSYFSECNSQAICPGATAIAGAAPPGRAGAPAAPAPGRAPPGGAGGTAPGPGGPPGGGGDRADYHGSRLDDQLAVLADAGQHLRRGRPLGQVDVVAALARLGGGRLAALLGGILGGAALVDAPARTDQADRQHEGEGPL